MEGCPGKRWVSRSRLGCRTHDPRSSCRGRGSHPYAIAHRAQPGGSSDRRVANCNKQSQSALGVTRRRGKAHAVAQPFSETHASADSTSKSRNFTRCDVAHTYAAGTSTSTSTSSGSTSSASATKHVRRTVKSVGL